MRPDSLEAPVNAFDGTPNPLVGLETMTSESDALSSTEGCKEVVDIFSQLELATQEAAQAVQRLEELIANFLNYRKCLLERVNSL